VDGILLFVEVSNL